MTTSTLLINYSTKLTKNVRKSLYFIHNDQMLPVFGMKSINILYSLQIALPL
ncbi:hypothetical protein D3C87_1856370 [compost metagenome]